jgi:SAM-dependent methyltransferase
LGLVEVMRGRISAMTSDASRHAETGAVWNETAAIYEKSEKSEIERLRCGDNMLKAAEQRLLGDLSPWCHRAIHLQCAGGTDTLSLWRLGASDVVGVDISERMIAVATRKAIALGAPASWHCCDVLETPHLLDSTADLVYTGKGAIPWMMDLAAWARVVARLLKPGGRLFVFEGHPLDFVWDEQASTYQFDDRHGDYFLETIVTDRGWPSGSTPVQNHPQKDLLHVHERQWTLGQIINCLIEVGLTVQRFEEHSEPFWDQFKHIPDNLLRRLPHTFSLMMLKEPHRPSFTK